MRAEPDPSARSALGRAKLTAGLLALVALIGMADYCPYSHPSIPLWNAAMGLGLFSILAVTLSARRRAEQRILDADEGQVAVHRDGFARADELPVMQRS